MKNQQLVFTIANILLLLGGISLGLVGAFGFEIISTVFGDDSSLTRIIYVLIGLSALYRIYLWAKRK
jgi:uncharacterized membrane protein YuzA (DUF378 family)